MATPQTSDQLISSRNLQELIGKLTVEEKDKSHDFWDTQPVPKLGMYGSYDECHMT